MVQVRGGHTDMGRILELTYDVVYSCSGFVSVCPLGQLTMENIYDMYAMPKHRLAVEHKNMICHALSK